MYQPSFLSGQGYDGSQMSSIQRIVYAQEIRKPNETVRVDLYWQRYDQKRGVYFCDITYRNVLSTFIFFISMFQVAKRYLFSIALAQQLLDIALN